MTTPGTITPELRHAIERDGHARIEDAETKTVYVVLRADHYERVKALFEDRPLSVAEQQAVLADMGRKAGWDDPAMDVYNELDPRR